ncbi:hypothetical protein HZZ00_37400 (plasmid) [Streptomyces sp. NEAU-sy36]|uniref:hypothetical protein n=1 Tax=unclassified Streptomyces TaxID=2593676 RepID=UPI0015D6568D|nr:MULTISPECIES: hypothetical protein [unclassified Streptomyces]QLJ06710.1 hypothetical protein HZZ00_37400 [Streptomyces sp. NEAU-sy36]
MLADDDPQLSPLWTGRRAPFQAFQNALSSLAGAYDLRDTRSNDPMTRICISVDDWHGQPIVSARRIPVAAFDDLLFAVQQLRNQRFEDNRRSGWLDQANADRRAANLERWKARGADMTTIRAALRAQYTAAAHRTEQPAGNPAHPNA